MRKTLENGFNNKNLTFISAGTILILIFLSVISYRKYIDNKKTLEETLEELEHMKKSMNENNTKLNLVMSRMNQKIDELQNKLQNNNSLSNDKFSHLNEIDSAVNNLLS